MGAEALGFALKFLLKRIDPLPRSTSAAEAKRVIPSCSFKDPVSGQVCGSRYQVEIDHIIPKALGGSDDPENLRPLCRQHNLHAAELAFGKEHMKRFRRA